MEEWLWPTGGGVVTGTSRIEGGAQVFPTLPTLHEEVTSYRVVISSPWGGVFTVSGKTLGGGRRVLLLYSPSHQFGYLERFGGVVHFI